MTESRQSGRSSHRPDRRLAMRVRHLEEKLQKLHGLGSRLAKLEKLLAEENLESLVKAAAESRVEQAMDAAGKAASAALWEEVEPAVFKEPESEKES